jgi:hypothetical protein
MIAAFLVAAMPLNADSADDYKVIKKAAKGKKGSSEITWFKLEVTDKKTNKATVKIKIPFALVDLLTDCVKDDIKIDNDKCDIDFKKVMKILKKHGPMTIVEVDEDDSKVRIWFE